MFTSTKISHKKSLVSAVSLALGIAAAPHIASATEYTFNWSGYFIMLDAGGAALGNTSAAKGTSQDVTQITGTLTYDDALGTGSMTIDDFDFFNGTAPAQAQSISLEYIGDGSGGAGTLMLSNILFNWNGTVGIPVSVAYDAAGLIDNTGTLNTLTVGDVVTGVGAIPASDGTYVGLARPGTYENADGYLAIGAMPLATTAWNTTNVGACTFGSCLTVNPSGELPLVLDVAANTNDYVGGLSGAPANDGGTIGGNPMQAGPFQGSNATFAVASMTLVSDGVCPTFTTPTDVTVPFAEAATPTTAIVDIGTVADEGDTANDVVEYSIDGGTTWDTDLGAGNNDVSFDLNETVNNFTVQWRVTADLDGCIALSSPDQNVDITITDTTAPVATFPADITVSVDSTADTVTFEGAGTSAGAVSATDATDPDYVIEWSLDNLNWMADTTGTNESSSSFASGANTVYWRVTDATGNETTHEQIVTLNLPTGIVGQPCDPDPDLFTADITRQLEGSFTMRDRLGNLVGTVDPAVTGTINGSVLCTDAATCTDSGATLQSATKFYGFGWTTNTIRLFNTPGTYTFETCLSDGSTNCSGPTPLSMTVGADQIGAHMLFDWNTTTNIDVVVVWDVGCGAAELASTDPDNNGIIGTSMVDGPFKGMNAAFDVSTQTGEQAITTGGYTTSIPAVNNPTAGASPLALDPGTAGTDLGGVSFTGSELSGWGAADDSSVVTSCVGGCFDFTVSGRATGETIQVVLPLSEPIPYYSLYRKYDVGAGSWKAFVTNATDSVTTALLNDDGRCPEPGAGDYTSYSNSILAGMLRPDDQCVQLTITDNGPNDDNPAAGTIADPSGVGLTSGPAAPTTQTTDGGAGGGCTLTTNANATQRLDLWLLASLMAFFGLRRKAQQK